MKSNKYVINQKNIYKKVQDLTIIKGYDLLTKKKIADTSINNINVISREFINNMINYKINKRFKSLLELIASVCESDDDPNSGLMFALTETERFKREMINKYQAFLSNKQKTLLDKKIELIEKEVKKRLYEYQLIKDTQMKLAQAMFDQKEENIVEHHRAR